MTSKSTSRSRLVAVLALVALFGGFAKGLWLSPIETALVAASNGGDERWLATPDQTQAAKIEFAGALRAEKSAAPPAPTPPAALAAAAALRLHPPYSPAPAPPNIAAPPAAEPGHDRPSPTGPPSFG